jgi:multidrug resistance efflux pump
VSSPDDIKVAEGDRIVADQVIADRTREREKLLTEREQLELAITKARQPNPTLPPPPEPTYAGELAAIEEAREMIAYWEQLPEPEYRFKQEDLILSLDTERVTQRQDLAQKRIEAIQELNGAIANLQTAKARYQRELYNYNISLTQAEAEGRQREIEALKLRERLGDLDKQIEEVTAVRSPYAGRVRKVKIINQNNLKITAEITLLVSKDEN